MTDWRPPNGLLDDSKERTSRAPARPTIESPTVNSGLRGRVRKTLITAIDKAFDIFAHILPEVVTFGLLDTSV